MKDDEDDDGGESSASLGWNGICSGPVAEHRWDD